MRDKTKRDNLVLGCGYALIIDSGFILIMFMLGSLQGVFQKMPIEKELESILMICFGGIAMAYMGYYFLKKEYEKPNFAEVDN